MAVVFDHGKCTRATGNARSAGQTLPNFLLTPTRADWTSSIAAIVTAKECLPEGSIVTSRRN